MTKTSRYKGRVLGPFLAIDDFRGAGLSWTCGESNHHGQSVSAEHCQMSARSDGVLHSLLYVISRRVSGAVTPFLSLSCSKPHVNA